MSPWEDNIIAFGNICLVAEIGVFGDCNNFSWHLELYIVRNTYARATQVLSLIPCRNIVKLVACIEMDLL